MKKILTAAVMLSVLNIFAGTLKFECSADRKDAIYKAGEKIIPELAGIGITTHS